MAVSLSQCNSRHWWAQQVAPVQPQWHEWCRKEVPLSSLVSLVCDWQRWHVALKIRLCFWACGSVPGQLLSYRFSEESSQPPGSPHVPVIDAGTYGARLSSWLIGNDFCIRKGRILAKPCKELLNNNICLKSPASVWRCSMFFSGFILFLCVLKLVYAFDTNHVK